MSKPKSVSGGLNLALIVMLIGLIGLLLEPLVFLAFPIVVGYVLYRLGKRVEELEARFPDQQKRPDNDKN